MSVEAAQAYYEYGNALLIQQEENPSDNLLGGNENQPLETQESVEIDETAAGEDEDDEDAGEEDKGEDDDLQIAWENLDVREKIRSSWPFLLTLNMHKFRRRLLALFWRKIQQETKGYYHQ